MPIPKDKWYRWEKFKKKEADLLFERDDALASGNKDRLIEIQNELYMATSAWMSQLMIWENSPDKGMNDIYQERKSSN